MSAGDQVETKELAEKSGVAKTRKGNRIHWISENGESDDKGNKYN